MLLQISEPGESPDPHDRKLAIGIDLGTTNSLVATVRSSVSEVLEDEQAHALLPSVVRYAEDGTVQVGHSALAQARVNPKNTIVSVKRLMGRSLADVDTTHLAYDLEGADEGVLRLKTRRGALTPIEISAEILKRLRSIAEARLGGDIDGAVITVPAYFDDSQRQATKDAAALAGIKVYRLLNNQWTLVANTTNTPMAAGEACWVYCRGASDYQGPITIKSSSGDTISFGSTAESPIMLENRTADPVSVKVETVSGADVVPLGYVVRGITTGKMTDITFDLPAQYLPPAIEAKQTSWLWLALKREKLAKATQSSLLKISTDSGAEVWLPVTGTRVP